jgi:hypothetical protein
MSTAHSLETPRRELQSHTDGGGDTIHVLLVCVGMQCAASVRGYAWHGTCAMCHAMVRAMPGTDARNCTCSCEEVSSKGHVEFHNVSAYDALPRAGLPAFEGIMP